jgi:serine/threonine-protein kinase
MNDIQPTQLNALPPDLGPWLDQTCNRFEDDWRAGRRPRIEDYLGDAAEPARSALLYELIRLEVDYRRKAGETPRPEEYQHRFPEVLVDWLVHELADLERAGRYRLEGEIARGGMGVVYRAFDLDVNRYLAVKVLRERCQGRPDLERRFLDEAQLTGQLQHPGIPPVHEIGRLADGRPFFAMKLIQGRTLDELLHERRSPADDLPRLVGLFAQVCQTVAYAHSRRVLHRDLKPGNVMVGAFGEVQVMDWGLAKALDGEAASRGCQPPGDSVTENPVTVTDAPPAGEPVRRTQPGAVMGTPAYMAPEQARGEVDRLDERCDVFGLGALLCEILTGEPPYVGADAAQVYREAKRGRLADAFARLDGCGADAELVRLARACLAAAPEERPPDAEAVAEQVAAYQAGVQERLRAAEVDRAAAQAKAAEARAKAAAERRARRLTVGLAAAVLVLALGGVSAWLWSKGQRDARAAAFDAGMDRSTGLLAEGKWASARAALKALPVPEDEARQRRVEAFLADLNMLERLAEIRAGKGDRLDAADNDTAYAQAFRDYGIDVEALGTEEAASRIRARSDPVARELLAALDDWAHERSKWQPEGWQQLVAVAQAADGDPWRKELRDLLARRDFPALRKLAEASDVLTQPVQSLQLLGVGLAAADGPAAVGFLRRVQRQHPADVWINAELARLLEQLRPPRLEEAIGFYRVAAATRPEFTHQVAKALTTKGDLDEAILLFRELTQSRPHNPRHHNGLGVALKARKELPAALAALDEALRLKPDYVEAHSNRGNVLTALRRNDDALGAFSEALRLKPNHAPAHYNRGFTLAAMGRNDDALDAFSEAVRFQPDFAAAHYNRGTLLATTRSRFDLAVAAFDQTVRYQPDHLSAHFNRGLSLMELGRPEEAAPSFAKVIQLQPYHPLAHCNLGLALQGQGQLADALKALRLGHELGSRAKPWPHPSEQWVRTAERLLVLDGRLSAVGKREDQPRTDEERLEFAQLCMLKKFFAASAGFYEEVFKARPKWAENLTTGLRYQAARAAAQAGCGQGKDEPPPDEPARARWRKQALDWLRADLALWEKQLDGGKPEGRATVERTLQLWLLHADLAGLRDEAAKLPEAERQAWRKLWAEVDQLLQAPPPAK